MLNVVRANFSALRKLSITNRLAAFNDPEGKTIFSALTPTQFAELFPRYYRQALPDIGGFIKALPSSVTAGRQKYYDEVIRKTASTTEGAPLPAWKKNWKEAADEQEKTAYVHRRGREAPEPPAAFTPEEQKAWDALQKGPISAGSDEAKALSSLSGEVLSKYGIEKFKDEKGQEMIRYNAPQVSREEAEKALKSSGSDKITSKSGSGLGAELGRKLMKDYGLTDYQAAGILAHLGHESMGFKPGINEQKPLVSGSRGGFGLAQWTGERRRRLEKFASDNGLDVSDPNTQYAYMKQEPEFKQYIGAVKNSRSMQEAAQAFARYESGGDPRWVAAWDSRMKWGSKALGWIQSGEGATPVKPEGPNGQYSDKQIADMQQKINQTKNEEQKQGLMRQLTEMHRSRGESVPGMGERVNVSGQSVGKEHAGKWDSIHLYKGGSSTGMCARGVVQVTKQLFAGNKFFDSQGVEGHGDAYQHKSGSFFTSSGLYHPSRPMSEEEIAMAKEKPPRLPPGAVVVMGGGKKGYIGHIQIMGNGEWLSDHRQKRFYAPGEGGGLGRSAWSDAYIIMPNERGQQQLAENGFAAPPPPTTTPKVEPAPTYTPPNTPEEYSPVPSDVSGMSDETTGRGTEQVQPLHADTTGTAQQRQVSATGETATPAPSQQQQAPNRFKVNQAGLIAAIKNTDEFKNTFGSSFATDNMILEGFANDSRVKDAGVTYDPVKGTMHIKDPNDPRVKKAMEGLDTKSFMTPIEEKKKKEEAKAKAAATPAPQAPAPTPEVKPLNDTTQPAPQNREVKVTDVPKQGEKPKVEAAPPPKTPSPTTPSNSPSTPAPEKKEEIKPTPPKNKTGGKVRVDEGMVSVPIPQQESDPRSDNMLAINPKTQENLFTYNSGEKIVYGSKNDQAQIIPQSKIGTMQDPITASAFSASKIKGNIGATPSPFINQPVAQAQTQNQTDIRSPLGPGHKLNLNANIDPNMIDNMMQHSGRIAKSPSAERAFSRAGFAETGCAIGGYHHSYGNSGTR